jgi:SAM-dependent methyltransferase
MDYHSIVSHYEDCYKKYGDSPRGVDWTQENQVNTRYKVMLDIISYYYEFSKIEHKDSMLDFGCGLSHLYEYIEMSKLYYINYYGLEISKKFFDASVKKFPNNIYYLLDILNDNNKINRKFDFVIMNGVFTEKRGLGYREMFDYFKSMMRRVYQLTNKGIAFNVMSKHVDWEKDFLFHVSFDDMVGFLSENLTRNFVIRNDYGLYEYTVYIFKK